MTDAGFDQLLEELDGGPQGKKKAPTFWAPEKSGDTIMGVLVGVEYADSKHARNVPVLKVERHPDGEMIDVWCFRKVLADQLGKKRPAMGSKIVIRFDGERQAQNGNYSYAVYSVVCEDTMELADGADWFKAAAQTTEGGNLQMF